MDSNQERHERRDDGGRSARGLKFSSSLCEGLLSQLSEALQTVEFCNNPWRQRHGRKRLRVM